MSEDTTLTLTLSLAEVNAVLQTLGTMPYAQVKPLIDKIVEQAQSQVKEQ